MGHQRVTAPSVPPNLPSFLTAELDLVFFDTLPAPPEASARAWTAAVSQIRAVDSLVANRFAGPAAILRAAAESTPQKHEDHWRWPFRVTHDGIEYDGWVGGGTAGHGIGWMITANAPEHTPPMVQHPWVVGVADWEAYAGSWQVVDPSSSPNPQQIEFHNDGNEPLILYRFPGGVLDFRRRGSARDLSITAFVGTDQRRIRWNTSTGQGQVLVWPSGEMLCWDRNQLDTMECFAPGS